MDQKSPPNLSAFRWEPFHGDWDVIDARFVVEMFVTSINSEWLYQVEFVNVLLAFCIDHVLPLGKIQSRRLGGSVFEIVITWTCFGRSWKTKGIVSVVWFENTEFRSELVCSHSWYFMGISQLLTPIHVIPHVTLFTSCFFGRANPPNRKNVTNTTPRWAPTTCSYRFINWVPGVITLLVGVITPFITDRGPPCNFITVKEPQPLIYMALKKTRKPAT